MLLDLDKLKKKKKKVGSFSIHPKYIVVWQEYLLEHF